MRSPLDRLFDVSLESGFPGCMDAYLDFSSALHKGTDFEDLIRSFYQIKRAFSQSHYLHVHRIRKWLESQFVITLKYGSFSETRELKLGFHAFETLLRAHRHEVYEHYLEVERFEDIQVAFENRKTLATP